MVTIEKHTASDTGSAGAINKAGRTITKAEASKVLERAGFSSHVIEGLLASLPDPIDLDHVDPKIVATYDLTPEHLMDMLGAGP